MEGTPYLAHIAEDHRQQTVYEHLQGTANLCKTFAGAFGAEDQGELAGLMHDIGKYSAAFQHRLLANSPKVDHSTAGALECAKLDQAPAAFCIAGHHAGLPDGGGRDDLGGTLWGRFNSPIPPYSQWSREITPPRAALPSFCRSPLDGSFFIRMLYSCLVDADFLDTERFMAGEAVPRGQATDPEALNCALDRYIAPWFPPKGTLNERRCDILRQCMEKGASSAPGLFTLTVPTGGGKTVASLAFALRHLRQNHMSRIIYVIPYTSIIEQTADVLRQVLGPEQVLEHHSGVLYDVTDEADPEKIRLARSTENWDMPVVVTTAVQFFESLYASRSSKCRKLHNLANSVILFDEAQMLPLPYLRPCVFAIAQLVAHYGATAVLCTATQPALNGLFAEYLPGCSVAELCPEALYSDPVFRRVTFRQAGLLGWDALAEQLNRHAQALCIVNSRKSAQTVYRQLKPDGAFHLSTLMYPAHRKMILSEIRRRLREGEPCRVVATSLIEAGVDVDFPAVFREEAGLDSILQAAGRCNREGRRSAEESMVTVFRTEGKTPPMLSIPVEAARQAMSQYDDLSSKSAVHCYFDALRYLSGTEAQDRRQILRQLERDNFPFRTVAEQFRLIDSDTQTIYIPDEDGVALVERLRRGERSRSLFRALGQFGVSVYEQHFRTLDCAGALELFGDGSAVLTDLHLYDPKTGLSLDADSGQALFG